jgi:hypothetical protein
LKKVLSDPPATASLRWLLIYLFLQEKYTCDPVKCTSKYVENKLCKCAPSKQKATKDRALVAIVLGINSFLNVCINKKPFFLSEVVICKKVFSASMNAILSWIQEVKLTGEDSVNCGVIGHGYRWAGFLKL